MVMLLALALSVSDDQLVARSQKGDRRAFGELVRRYQDRVYSTCLRWLGDPHLAEETAQDVFMAIYRALPTFRGDARFSTYLFRVAVNHCKNRRLYGQRRGHGRHESVDAPSEDDDRPARQLADERPVADALLWQAQADSLLWKALSALDEGSREILILRDVNDLPYEEIAEVLDLPRGTVKSRIHRARAQLASALARVVRKEDVL